MLYLSQEFSSQMCCSFLTYVVNFMGTFRLLNINPSSKVYNDQLSSWKNKKTKHSQPFPSSARSRCAASLPALSYPQIDAHYKFFDFFHNFSVLKSQLHLECYKFVNLKRFSFTKSWNFAIVLLEFLCF